MAAPILALALTTVTFFSTSIGGLIALRYHRDLILFIAYAGGALIGIAFLELLPEALNVAQATQLAFNQVMLAVILGFLYYHIAQRSIAVHSHRKAIHGATDLHAVGIIGATGLSIHSFLDGFAIGVGFQTTLQVGLIIALAVILHDFSDGLNTVTLMLRAGNTRRATFSFLLMDALAPILGAVIGSLLGVPEFLLALMLGFFAGEFLSIGGSDLLPEADEREKSWRILILTVLGIVFIYGITRLLP